MEFYLALQEDHEIVFDMIKNTPHSETLHKLAREVYNERIPFNRVSMAWSVWLMTNASFTGSPHGSWRWCNGVSGSDVGKVLGKKRNQMSEALYNRIKFAQISCKDAIKVIESRDRDNTFFYLDPPYPGANQKHYRGYTMKDLIVLLDLLETIKGKFILSNYWSQTLKMYIARNNWHTVSIKGHVIINQIHRESTVKSKVEWLIMNFTPPVNLKQYTIEL